MISDEEINRMRWAARRGMLELDLVLEPFVRQCYADLEAEDRRRFRELLLREDQELFAWFLRRERPAEEDMQRIVARILQFAHTRTDGTAL